MSLMPLILSDYAAVRPSRLVDQHFGLGLDIDDDLISPLTIPSHIGAMLRRPRGYYRPWRSAAAVRDTGSTIVADKDKFQVNLDVQHFAPEEVTVKSSNNTIIVEGKHEEKEDEHGFVFRHFVRKYTLPEGHDVNNIESHLSSDGVLSITAPRLDQIEQHRSIPIQQTGVPMKAVKDAKQQEGGDAKK